MHPEVSVIIPVYNAERWLAECLDGILAQTLSDFEVICVNDGSNDASLAILEKYAAADERIVVFSLDGNMGSGIARNRGIDLARGRYLLFCDADDLYPPNALEVLHARITETQTPLCAGNIVPMDTELKKILPLNTICACMQIFDNSIVRPMEYPPLWVPYFHPRYMISANIIRENNIRYPDLLRGQDPPFLAQLLCMAERVAVCPNVVYYYRSTFSERKLSTGGKALDYLEHIRMTCDIFLRHEAKKQAMLYLAINAREQITYGYLKNVSSDERRKIADCISGLLVASGERFWSEDFSPYAVETNILKDVMTDLQRGYGYFLFKKCIRRVREMFRQIV